MTPPVQTVIAWQAGVDFRILGPFEVHDGQRVLSLGGTRQRAVLAVLLLHANQVVSSDRLIDELWGDEPPKAAAASLRVFVSELRKILEPGRRQRGSDQVPLTRPPGYMIRLDRNQLDLERFEQLLEAGRRALADGDTETAAGGLREALSLWRGPPLADFAYEPFAQAAIGRLEELRLSAARRLRVEADLALRTPRRTWSASSRRSSRSIPSASACVASSCSRCTAPAARLRPSTPTAWRAARSSRGWGSSRARRCRSSSGPSSVRTASLELAAQERTAGRAGRGALYRARARAMEAAWTRSWRSEHR